MKIYNKKNFRIGMYFSILSAALLVLDLLSGFKTDSVILMVLCCIIGTGFLVRSLSKGMSGKDILAGLDERNRLIFLKSHSKANSITQAGCVLLAGLFFGIGRASGADWMEGAGVGVLSCLAVSLLAEFFAGLYYEKKN